MWPSLSFNRPLVWMGLVAFSASAWLPNPGLRIACLGLVLLAALDAWRQVRLECLRSRLAQQVMLQSADAVMITDAGFRILAVNPAFSEITGYAADEVQGLNAANLAASRHDTAFFARFHQRLQSTGRWEGEMWQRRRSGEEFPEWLSICAVTAANGRVQHLVGVFSDISLHKAREQDLRRIGREDPLTGLPNRRRLNELLASRLRHMRAGENLDLALIDIRGFKDINDAMGVDVGDRLLARFGKRLACHVAGGVVGRMGGDEFMVLRTTTYEDHESWVEDVRRHLLEPFSVDGVPLRLGITVGSCRAPEDGSDHGVLFQRLESALCSAQRLGGNQGLRFRPALNVESVPDLGLLNDLRTALTSGDQLELHYQPQHRLGDGELVGAEALLRWRHPQQGMIPPDAFIGLAERHGLMASLGSWVISQAAAQLAHWHSPELTELPVWINISAMQLFQGNLESTLSSALHRHGLPAYRLGVELTESVLLDERAGDIVGRLQGLRRSGHPVALDDFGTGYSSLGYLKHLPVDKLKLDRAFVQALPEDPADVAIVDAVVSMASGLGLQVIAEGVESREQRDHLLQAGCQLAQGYFYAAPMPAEEFERYGAQLVAHKRTDLSGSMAMYEASPS
ncbi:hypothetical protein HCU01_29190 [Halomonas cupida]|uniref:PAS domain S-box-containing protein/diguanylate cyclase (GGDEF) domain-containing protein n=1 Tax=Halomonas cupida TaxID=44933 RepID=A0A1M7K9T7_9GAMM|nr:GGDEF domain-containing phosphodiesterase [Halomonas cupida]GEN24970.1 hypothetical protein HCU01_29190 [Halomonas cupida]SHM61597.1 PAS domain S-box-containing protein/diguanylate cyclase (GGDEF) domain-containing protein [Halomonas cupida]